MFKGLLTFKPATVCDGGGWFIIYKMGAIDFFYTVQIK